MGRLTKWCESLQEWQENHDNDERKGFQNGHRVCMTKLGEYENAEEQGLLVQMPCKQGTRVYYITRNHIEVGQYCAKANGNESIISTDKYGRVYWCDDDDWFYTYDVAKKVLAKRNAQNARKASECLLCRFSDIQRVCADKKAGTTCEFYRGEQE